MQTYRKKQDELSEYLALKQQINLPLKIKIYFSIFQSILEHKISKNIQSRKGFSKLLLDIYTNLSEQQKIHFLLKSIKYLHHKCKENKILQQSMIKNIQTTCHMANSMITFNYWSIVSFKFDKSKRQIIVKNKNKCFIIQLKHYFGRRSKKHRYALVLEAISQQIAKQDKRFTFLFGQSLFKHVYQQIMDSIITCCNQQLLPYLQEDNLSNDKALVFLNNKNINEYLNYKQTVIKRLLIGKLDFQICYQNDMSKIQRSSKIQNLFKLQSVITVNVKQVKQQFFKSMKKYRYLLDSVQLQTFSKKYIAVYQRYAITNYAYQLISIKQQTNSQQQEILFVKGIQNVMTKNYLEFLYVKVRAMGPEVSKLIILTSVDLSAVKNLSIISSYLIEFRQMLFRPEEDQQQFRTVVGSNGQIDYVEDDFQVMEDDEIEQPNYSLKMIQPCIIEYPKSDQYLIKKHLIQPTNQTKFQLMKQHFLFRQWARRKNGGVICTNQQTINLHKKLFKAFLANMGTNIIKNKGIINTSIPVFVFKKQSHLKSIARDFCYAPLFIDKLVENGNPLERMKHAILLVISVGVLGISMDKPFNPILGETYQAWIGGTPIYLQQISHHPPIGAYYMKGRGYQIYGQIEPKINLGLNNVKGFSERPNYLIYKDGTKIQMAYAKMIIKGLLFGQREFNFEQKVYAYDQKNHLFGEINYGPRHRGFLGASSEPLDFFHGKIYKLKPEYVQKFISTMPRIYPPKQMIVSQLSQFQGIWNDVVKFDGTQYVNFRTQLPCQLIQQEFPLASNANYRTDLVKLLQGTIDQAQQQKDRLEEVQRRDRKLRQNYKNKNKH